MEDGEDMRTAKTTETTAPQPMAMPPSEPPLGSQIAWETPTHPPKRGLLARILPFSSSTTGSSRATAAPESDALSKEEAGLGSNAAPPPTVSPAASTTATPTTTSLKASLRRRLDTILPPHRRYLGRTRRFFLLYILLPSAILLLLALILGLGLGLGLRRSSSPYQNLPLPADPGTGVFTGDLTYYAPALGACGWTNSASDSIVAVSHFVFDAAARSAGSGANPNANPLCGRRIRVVRDYVEVPGTGNRSVDVTVVDRCVGCRPDDLDLAPAVFDQLAPEAEGRVTGSWAWLD